MRGKQAASLVVSAVAAASVAACNPILGPGRVDSNWNVHETSRFTLHVRPGSFAEQNIGSIGQGLEEQYDGTLAAIGARFDNRIAGFLYNSAQDAELDSDYSGVGYPETLAFRATCVPPADANLFSLLAHEANHVILMGALGRGGTSFMNEGLASALLTEPRHNGKSSYYAWTKRSRAQIPPLARLVEDDEWQNVAQNVSYSASASFLAYVLQTYGAAGLRGIYYAPSGDFAARFAAVYGKPLTEVEAEWLAFCEAFGR